MPPELLPDAVLPGMPAGLGEPGLGLDDELEEDELDDDELDDDELELDDDEELELDDELDDEELGELGLDGVGMLGGCGMVGLLALGQPARSSAQAEHATATRKPPTKVRGALPGHT